MKYNHSLPSMSFSFEFESDDIEVEEESRETQQNDSAAAVAFKDDTRQALLPPKLHTLDELVSRFLGIQSCDRNSFFV